ncbi:MAG: hypothetical protein IPM02_13445 [Betaproteobacteria bacterium]|nr:hypothetical protein [Betaproteobacteria bacterium]
MAGDAHREYADAAGRWFASSAGPARLRRFIDGDPADERALWDGFSGFGLGELIADETDPGERAQVLAQVALQAGRFLYAGPLAEAVAQELLGMPAAPGALVLAALPQAGAAVPRWRQHDRTLTGALCAIPYAGAAERWLVAAADTRGSVLADTVRAPRTLAIAGTRQADGTANATLEFAAHPADACDAIGSGPPAAAAIAELRDLLVMSTAARLIGAADEACVLAREHLLLRTQFGRKLASFQVLQHQAVDHYTNLQLARALLEQVLAHWQAAATREVALPALKAFSATAGLAAAKNAVQMFGAAGFAHEGDAGLYLRHVMTLACRYGDAPAHRRAFAALEFDFLK